VALARITGEQTLALERETAVAARGGASLEEVAAEARGALAMKASQLGAEEPAAAH